MSVDASRMGPLIRSDTGSVSTSHPGWGGAVTGSGAAAAQPDAVTAESAPEVASASSPPGPPRNWVWLSQSVEKLLTLCRREASLTSHSRETLQWEALANRLQEVHGKLTGRRPGVDLGSLKHPPRPGEEDAYHAAAELVKSTAEVVTKVSQTAAEGGQKTPRGILELCGKIILGILATVGVAAGSALVPVAGPQLAIASVILGVGAVTTVALAHAEHNRHVLEFQQVDDLLAQLNAALMKQEEQDGAPV